MRPISRLRQILFAKAVRILHPSMWLLTDIHDLLLEGLRREVALHRNPLSRCATKVFSQADEDGITLEVVKRLGLGRSSTFAEFGVGDGLENNTLALAALGWRGVWIGGEQLVINVPQSSRFFYKRAWVTLSNVLPALKSAMETINLSELDVLSFDLDGNDFYLVEQLLRSAIRPKLFIVEYNAKFPPPMEFKIEYRDDHIWHQDDYFGASLTSFVKLFESYDYRLICCNPQTGSNAFFVRNEYADKFKDVPNDIAELYERPNYVMHSRFAHKPSPKTVELILSDRFVASA